MKISLHHLFIRTVEFLASFLVVFLPLAIHVEFEESQQAQQCGEWSYDRSTPFGSLNSLINPHVRLIHQICNAQGSSSVSSRQAMYENTATSRYIFVNKLECWHETI
mmetsp:Transcript_30824/g.68264  ORF Transcript_30824/g.68264 Transcript_30824/m.68264 type:complete len:107 (+) Transcript_30824:324-644(+)